VTAAAKKFSVMIVDDEELARHVLRELLHTHAEMEVVAECANGVEAVKAVAEKKPDLIFLDVQMPKLTGFDVLELIGNEIPVIFERISRVTEHTCEAQGLGTSFPKRCSRV